MVRGGLQAITIIAAALAALAYATSVAYAASDTISVSGSFTFNYAEAFSPVRVSCSWTGILTVPEYIYAGKQAKITVTFKDFNCAGKTALRVDLRLTARCGDRVIASSVVGFKAPPDTDTITRSVELAVPPSCDSEFVDIELVLTGVKRSTTYAVSLKLAQDPKPLAVRVKLLKPGLPKIEVKPTYIALEPQETGLLEIRLKAIGGGILVKKVEIETPPMVSAALETGLPVKVDRGSTLPLRLRVLAMGYTSGIMNITIYAAPVIDPDAVHTVKVYVPVVTRPPKSLEERVEELEEKLNEVKGTADDARRIAREALNAARTALGKIEAISGKLEELAIALKQLEKRVEDIEARLAKAKLSTETITKTIARTITETSTRIATVTATSPAETVTVVKTVTKTLTQTAAGAANTVATTAKGILEELAGNPLLLAAALAVIVIIVLLLRR